MNAVPVTGLVVLPLTFLVFAFRPRWLLSLTILLAPFQAASALNIGTGPQPIGLQPGFVAAIAYVTYTFLHGGITPPRALKRLFHPLFLFAGYVTFTAITMPRLFAGTVEVFPPNSGLSLDAIAPLQPADTNVFQTLLILFLVVFTFIAASEVAKGTEHALLVRAYIAAGVTVSAIGLSQVAAATFGLPFPDALIYSNAGYAQHHDQMFGGFTRLSATFTEPSVAAYYLSGFFAFALTRFLFHRPRQSFMLVLLSGSAAMLTLSTTAYASLAIVGIVLAIRSLGPERQFGTVLVALVACAMLLSAAAIVAGTASVAPVASGVVFDKLQSASFEDRTGADVHSLRLILETWGFGVGWGSNRSSSLATNVLSNAGLWGTILLAIFSIAVVRHCRLPLRLPRQALREVTDARAFAYASAAMLVAGIIAIPDATFISFWVSLSLLLGFITHLRTTRGARSDRAPPRLRRHLERLPRTAGVAAELSPALVGPNAADRGFVVDSEG